MFLAFFSSLSVSDKLCFAVKIGDVTIHSPTHSATKIYKFSELANFALIPDAPNTIRIELLNAKRRPQTSLGEISLDIAILSEKQVCFHRSSNLSLLFL
jgi:hypothetical protein